MRCGRVRRKLTAYHDGELGLAVRNRIAKHLENCDECGGLLRALERADLATGSAGVPHPESSYWNTFTGRVMDKVRNEASAGRSEPHQAPARSGFSPLRLAPALSIALVVVVAAGVLMKVRQPVIPERSVPKRDAVVKKEIPPAPEEQDRSGLGNEGASHLSKPVKSSPAAEPVEQVYQSEMKEPLPEPVTGAATIKREAGADERERIPTIEDETGIRFMDRDDSLMTATPLQPEGQAARSTLLAPAPETIRESTDFLEKEKPLSTEGDIDDGSWGQLAFARKLEEEGRHFESEKVLDDLLAQNPAVPVQEQASLLLVSVLTNQNRLPEARQILKDAQRQYPANLMIQNYKLENGER